MALKAKIPLWYTSSQPDSPLHSAGIGINTAVIMPTFSFEAQQEFYVVLFSFRKLEVRYRAPLLLGICGIDFSFYLCLSMCFSFLTHLSPPLLPISSSRPYQSSGSKLAYLRFLSKAAVTASSMGFFSSASRPSATSNDEELNNVSH